MMDDFQNLLADEASLTHLSKVILEKLDGSRKGYLNKSEVKEFFEEVADELETHISQSELDEIFCELDLNSSMRITHEEIKSMLKQLLHFLNSEARII